MIWLWILLILIVGFAALTLYMNREVVSGLEVLNPNGSPTALVVYHPGLSDLLPSTSKVFAESLASKGWRVELTTTSTQAPANLDRYSLLALGVHTYWFAPDWPTGRYLNRLGDLKGKPVVAIVYGLGATGRSQAMTERMVKDHGGKMLKAISLWVLRPNSEEPGYQQSQNRQLALGKVRQLAGELQLAR